MTTRAPSLLVTAAATLLAATGCIANHRFAAHGDDTPDVAQLEQARRALADGGDPGPSTRGLTELTWIPLVAMHLDRYGTSDPSMRAGTTMSEIEAYGPLAMAGDRREWLFDDRQELYERRRRAHFAWGLWASDQTEVKVPGGWRVEAHASLLFGLLRWPTTVYVAALPGRTPDGP